MRRCARGGGGERGRCAAAAALALLLATVAAGATAAPETADDAAAQRPSAREAAPLAGACAQAIAARVQTYYDAVADLRAGFRQRTRRVGFAGHQPSSLEARGEVILAKPSRMRWAYATPQRSIIVTDGSELWIYDEEAAEAQRYVNQDAAWLTSIAMQFLIGEGNLLRDFSITADRCDEDWVALALLPRSPTNFERIDLVVSARSGEVRETGVVDLLGNHTELRFTAMRINTNPAAEVFQFRPPPGTRVLEAGAPAGAGAGLPDAVEKEW